jgi:hypothetical protein
MPRCARSAPQQSPYMCGDVSFTRIQRSDISLRYIRTLAAPAGGLLSTLHPPVSKSDLKPTENTYSSTEKTYSSTQNIYASTQNTYASTQNTYASTENSLFSTGKI